MGSGHTTWRVGDRVRFYRARGNARRLIDDFSDDYDAEYYVRRLRSTYVARLSKAIDEEGLHRLLDDQLELFAPENNEVRLLTSKERSVGSLAAYDSSQ